MSPIAFAVVALAPCLVWRRRLSREALRHVALVFAAVGASWLIHQLLATPGFLHQNGQGPVWIGIALGEHFAHYGPGYQELFAWCRRFGNPDGAVFTAMSIAVAAAALGASGLGRAIGLSRKAALMLSLPLVCDPVLARVGASESYFAVGFALNIAAMLWLAVGARIGSARSGRFVLATAGAGLVICQVARTHPLLWQPAALCPLAVLALPGRRSRRAAQALAALVVVGALVVLTSGGELYRAVRYYRTEMMGVGSSGVIARLGGMAVAYAALGFIRNRLLAGALAAAAIVYTTHVSNVVIEDNPLISAAHDRLFVPALVTCAAAALRGASTSWQNGGGAVLAVVASVYALLQMPIARWRSVDSLETTAALDWRQQVKGQRIAYVGRAGRRVLFLPVYAALGFDDQRIHGTRDANAPIPQYYYRSSLCSSDEGRALCADLESRWTLEPVFERTLPARHSQSWLTYSGPVTVGLFRVQAD